MTQALQKSYTASAGNFISSQVKIKQEAILEVGNKGKSNRRQYREPYKRKTNNVRSNTKPQSDRKPRRRCGKTFGEGHLKLAKM